MKLPIFQVDAFADNIFKGNQAAVIVMEKWLSQELMQQIAAENNLAETAFVVISNNQYEIRWYTPKTEVDLCGHATLAAAFVLFNYFDFKLTTISFLSKASGILKVNKKTNQLYELDFPLDTLEKNTDPLSIELLLGLGVEPIAKFNGKSDFMLVFKDQSIVENLVPDFNYLRKAKGRGIIVTAPGDDVDFVSRFFAPQIGIDEDPVTGSAHTTLLPYWHSVLGKTKFVAKQLSKRGGTLYCEIENQRAKIAGHAVLFMRGEINI